MKNVIEFIQTSAVENAQPLNPVLDLSMVSRMNDNELLEEVGRFERLLDMELFVDCAFSDIGSEFLDTLKDECIRRFRRMVVGDTYAV